MQKRIDTLLANHFFFKGMDPSALDFVAGCGKNVRFGEGEFLARQGDPADAFYAVRDGRIAVEIDVPPHGPVTIQTVQTGDMLGWSWLIQPYKWMFDGRALEPTRVVQFDARCLRKKCEDNPAFGYDIMKRFARLFAKRLEATLLQMLDVYGKAADD